MTELFRFACVGLFIAAVYYVLYLALSQTPMPIFVVNALAFGISVVLQYILQSKWTFQKDAADTAQITKFVVTIGLGFVLSTVITVFIGPALQLGASITGLIVVITLPISNYILFKIWVFKTYPS